MSWLWWGGAAWIATDLLIAAAWAWHRSREKRNEEVRERLREIGRLRAVEASTERDVTLAEATRRRLVETAALRTIPHQTRRTEEDQ